MPIASAVERAKPSPGPFGGGFYRLARSGDTNPKREKAAIVGNGLWGTIIAILVVVVLVIVILNLT